MSKKPRAKTVNEIRKDVLNHVYDTIDNWEHVDATVRQKLEGVAFSILSMLDGESGCLPQFLVALDPTSTDQKYYKLRGENWYPSNEGVEVKGNIAGDLHNKFCPPKRRKPLEGTDDKALATIENLEDKLAAMTLCAATHSMLCRDTATTLTNLSKKLIEATTPPNYLGSAKKP